MKVFHGLLLVFCILIGLYSCKKASVEGTEKQTRDSVSLKKAVLQDLCWSADGQSLYFSAMIVKPDFSNYHPGLWTVYQYVIDTQQLQIIQKGALNVSPSPTGDRLAFTMNNRIALYDLATKDVSFVTDSSRKSMAPSWSPVADHLAFTVAIDSSREIFTLDLQTNVTKQLTNSHGHSAYNPSWSPDGEKIAYYLEKGDGRDQLYVVDKEGMHTSAVTSDTFNNIFPGWVDTQTLIYGQGSKDTPTKTFVVNVDGSGKEQVLNLESMYARYSPTRNKIAYINTETGVIEIVSSTGEKLDVIDILSG